MIERAVKLIKNHLPAYGEGEHIAKCVQNDVRKACEYAGVKEPSSGLTQKQYIALAASRIINKATEVGVLWGSL